MQVNKLICLVVLLILINSISSSLAAETNPNKIVSTQLCTDQLVLLIADHDNILSLSFLSHQPDMSILHKSAKSFPGNRGYAEEIVKLDPDIIFTNPFGNSNLLILRKLGYRIVEVPLASSLEDVRKNIRTVAKVIGEQERGEKLIQQLNERIVELSPKDDARPILAKFGTNGYTFGSETLVSETITRAGYRNLAVELGMSSVSVLPLEVLIKNPPDVLLAPSEFDSYALANELPLHPSIEQAFTETSKIDVDNNLWICGTPFVAEALRQLVEFRAELLGINSQ